MNKGDISFGISLILLGVLLLFVGLSTVFEIEIKIKIMCGSGMVILTSGIIYIISEYTKTKMVKNEKRP